MLQNFMLGVDALGLYLKSIVLSFLHHQVVLGFLLGFIASTSIHMIVVAERTRHIPHIITKQPAASYRAITSQDESGAYNESYFHFLKAYYRVRIAFYSAAVTLLAIILVVIMRF